MSAIGEVSSIMRGGCRLDPPFWSGGPSGPNGPDNPYQRTEWPEQVPQRPGEGGQSGPTRSVDGVSLSPEVAELKGGGAGQTAGGAQGAQDVEAAGGTSADQQVQGGGGTQGSQGANGGGEELSERVKWLEQALQGMANGGANQQQQASST